MKILIISPSWIGDTVMSHSIYRLITKFHQNFSKNLIIDVIAPTWCHAVLNRMSEVNQVLCTPYTHNHFNLKKCYNFSKFLKNKKYQQSITLPNSFKSALIPFFAKIPTRTGWRGEMRYGILNDLRVLHKKSFPLMVQRYAALAYKYNDIQHFSDLPNPLPLPYLNTNETEINNVLHKFHLYNYKKSLIGLCPGSESGPSKKWPHYHFITLIIQLIYHGYHVAILGSLHDIHFNQFLKHNNTLKNLNIHHHNLIGITSLDEAILIIAACKGIISNDSGLMHIACALQRPVVALYGGSSTPNFTPPLYHQSIIIHNHHKHNKTKKNNKYGYHDSLINIHPDQVLKKLKKILL